MSYRLDSAVAVTQESLASGAAPDRSLHCGGMPTKHIVLVKVRSDVSAEEVQRAFAPLAALQGQIPGLTSFSWGPNTSPEGRTQGFTHGFVMDFADAAARDAYLPDPRHQAAAAGLRTIREPEGGVLVFDYDY